MCSTTRFLWLYVLFLLNPRWQLPQRVEVREKTTWTGCWVFQVTVQLCSVTGSRSRAISLRVKGSRRSGINT